MRASDEHRQLRGAVARGDGARLLQLLNAGPWPADALQLIGDGLLVALREHHAGAQEPARRCAGLLRVRGWEGDDILADALQARLGEGATRLLKPLIVDLDALATILEGDPTRGGGCIDLITGEVWPQSAIDDGLGADGPQQDRDDPRRWVPVECAGSRPGYRDMERFIANIDDAEAARALAEAIIGRGAFRRFKGTLSQWPALIARWAAFADDRQRGRARAWLARAGYAAMPVVFAPPQS